MLLLGTPATAQSLTIARACANDLASLCKGVQPGKGRMGACVRAHLGDLSSGCQAVVMKAAVVGKACAADVKMNCGGMKPGVTFAQWHCVTKPANCASSNLWRSGLRTTSLAHANLSSP
jgi:hypothetical protein